MRLPREALRSLAQLVLAAQQEDEPSTGHLQKSIAIVGGGTGGIGVLKALLDLPNDVRDGWRIDLFEQRSDVGGVWLEDAHPPDPPELPETPLYDLLRTNTPHPAMTYPGHPFPPLTPLYPLHPHVLAYHRQFADAHNLTDHIWLQHEVVDASWVDSVARWNVTVCKQGAAERWAWYDHLVVASGHNHYPHIPQWNGTDEWLGAPAGRPPARRGARVERELLHSIYYRRPHEFANRTVVVVGHGASGTDMAQQLVPFALEVIHSFTDKPESPLPRDPVPGTTRAQRILRFDRDGIDFVDRSRLQTTGPTSVLLGTGYELLVPFLADLRVAPTLAGSDARLTTNKNYVRPLYKQVWALDARLPRTALAFVGLPVWIANAPSDYAQGLFVAHALAQDGLLPGREQSFAELREWEAGNRRAGWPVETYGHRFVTEGSSNDYQDDLVAFVRARSRLPLPPHLANRSGAYVEEWRRRARVDSFVMKQGWLRVEHEGREREFLQGAVTEEDWVGVMERVKQFAQE